MGLTYFLCQAMAKQFEDFFNKSRWRAVTNTHGVSLTNLNRYNSNCERINERDEKYDNNLV